MDTILIVDDEPTNIKILQEALKEKYRILAATSGDKALALLDRQLPDLILLDVVMPGMNGYQLCKEIRERTDVGTVPVLFVSAQDSVEDKTRGFDAGGMDYITKPFEIPEVLARVRTHLELQRSRKFKEEVENITRHDLKAPLQAMMGLPDLMLYEGNLDETQTEYMTMIKDAAKKMLGMINLGLDLFKMEMNMYQLQAEEIDITKLLNSIMRERLRADDSVEYALSISDNTADSLIKGENLLLYSLFNNLLQNAWEASDSGDVIEISVNKEESHLNIIIRNSGEVPMEIRDNFFGKYVTAGKSNGTGLGTYSAQLIAKEHEAELALDSSESGKTSITVRFPL